MRKKYIRFISLFILLFIFIVAMKFVYPSESSISNYHLYEYKNYKLDDSLSIVINTNNFIGKNNKTNINQLIKKQFDTNILLKSLEEKNGYMIISIYFETKWNLIYGKCISVSEIHQDGTSSSSKPSIILLDENNKEIQYNNIGSLGLSTVNVIIDKEEFYRHKDIKILFTSLPVLEYSSKFLR